MAQTFFWYDLETSGISPREGRIMQFAGQRTDMDLQPIGEPVNIMIKLAEDVLPDPDAIMVTGITPQATLADGITEAEFMQIFSREIATPDTIFVGYNTVRFDDEFMRFLHFRNFYDPYEWQWKDGRSRWDLLDVVRMTRALRPDGIQWPMTEDGKPTNRLELLTKVNGLDHEHAHDALNDVLASIAVAQLIKDKQPKLFAYLLGLREKTAVRKFLEQNQTFLYTSGKYPSEAEKTAAVQLLHIADTSSALVYNLAVDPTEFVALSAEQLAERWKYDRSVDAPPRLPVKTMKFNRCPAISPTGLLSEPAVQQRLKISPETMQKHRAILHEATDFTEKLLAARTILDTEQDAKWGAVAAEPEAALYEGGFISDADKTVMSAVRAAEPAKLGELAESFADKRLQEIVPHYKARNYPQNLSDEERVEWEAYRKRLFFDNGENGRLGRYLRRLAELAETDAGRAKQYLLEELQLYAESIVPYPEAD